MISRPGGVCVRVPATSANLGPGFDCLGLALDWWNEVEFRLEGDGVRVEVRGEGAATLPQGRDNLIAVAALRLFERAGQPAPRGLHIRCNNTIPLGSGLGSSAAAVLSGLLGANRLLDDPFEMDPILELATEMEGHPDNAAPALWGGLTAALKTPGGVICRRIAVPALALAVATPQFDLPTHAARAALPGQVPLADAVFNLSCTTLVVEALRSGDLDLLAQVMDDRLHQPYRLPLIPGAQAARQAALDAGAVACVLSGAGPSLLAVARGDAQPLAEAMTAAFRAAGLAARAFTPSISPIGAQVASSR
ncbi:homoserine kinase [Longilinea arvoryzae]|uniref:Homoserine kinase n=1 Tax=Longilinea arvoryzae TaxID=360412 RepID=A0A0S7B7K6_9CHLR|nr:homoserine kinase [Longilinea arvoryzae]GAP13359.1 homoserine kinase [Longilinea arvoryzae]